MIGYLKCQFCTVPQQAGKGLIVVTAAGFEKYYCTRGCRINAGNKRKLKTRHGIKL